MMIWRAEVTGSFTPTVAKHTQSVEPAMQREQILSELVTLYIYTLQLVI